MNFGTKGCMYNCGDECTGECMKVETKTKMSKKSIYKVTEQGWQYCNYCKKETWHTPKLGLVASNKRLCTRCNSSNELNQNKDER